MTTLLDDAVPSWQFRERHQTYVRATPERVYAAMRAVPAREIFLFRTLVAIRRCGRPGSESILNPGPDAPLLDVALRSGFHLIAEEVPREIVIGMYVIQPKRALAVMNFRLEPEGDRVLLTTETRITVTDLRARITFGCYWLAIRAGSAFIRRMWLRAIRTRAERG
jgi:hypothetical protein